MQRNPLQGVSEYHALLTALHQGRGGCGQGSGKVFLTVLIVVTEELLSTEIETV